MERRLSLEKAIIPENDPIGEAVVRTLRCPNCGFDYQHFGTPLTIPGNDNYEAGWGGRGDLFVIPIWGECGSRWEICFGDDKGNTKTFIRIVKSCEESQKYVYFIEAVGLSRVKIGISDNPEKRISQLATGSAVPLKLLATIPGDLDLEQCLHHRFDHLRFDKEWFHATKELLAFISDLMS